MGSIKILLGLLLTGSIIYFMISREDDQTSSRSRKSNRSRTSGKKLSKNRNSKEPKSLAQKFTHGSQFAADGLFESNAKDLKELANKSCTKKESKKYGLYLDCLLSTSIPKFDRDHCFKSEYFDIETISSCDKKVHSKRIPKNCSKKESQAIISLSQCMIKREIVRKIRLKEYEKASFLGGKCLTSFVNTNMSPKCLRSFLKI